LGSNHTGDPFAHLPARTPLYDGDQLVLVFTLEEMLRSGRPWADLAWRPPDVPPDVAADVALSTLEGYALSTTDPTLVEALAARGSTELRHAHTMTHSLHPVPDVSLPTGAEIFRITGDDLAANADTLAKLHVAAYGEGHPDREFDDPAPAARELRRFASGEILGPYLDVSTVGRVDGAIAGACIVVDRDGEPPDGGPWIVDVFRDPAVAVRGLGAALIAGAIAACVASGFPAIGLAVTHANESAYGLYRRLGFTDTAEAWTLALPGIA
jgi:ribosomal protein S18 acetylase RimI-like enzyme